MLYYVRIILCIEFLVIMFMQMIAENGDRGKLIDLHEKLPASLAFMIVYFYVYYTYITKRFLSAKLLSRTRQQVGIK